MASPSRQELISVTIKDYPQEKRVCGNIFLSPCGGCVAYSETPLQTKGNVGLELGAERGYVPSGSLENQQGFCQVTGAVVYCRCPCGVGQQNFQNWVESKLYPPDNQLPQG